MREDEDTLRRQFGGAIRTIRLERGMSQEEVAYRAGLNRNHVGGLERGKMSPSLITLVRLSAVFELAPSELLQVVIDQPSAAAQP